MAVMAVAAAMAWTALPVAAAPGVQTLAVQVLAVQVLSGGPAAGASRLELSDLAWDAARRQLLAVSDRGRLHVYAWPEGGDAPLAVRPLHRQTLPGRPNLEAMALDPDGRLHLVDELSGRVLQMDRAGPEGGWSLDSVTATEGAFRAVVAPTSTTALPLEPPRATPMAPRPSGHGIEAAMWMPGEGLTMARQLPVDGLHHVVAATGRAWTLRPTGSGSTLKALARLDADRLVALEKVRRPGPDGHVLRVWSASCIGDAPCPTQDLPLADPRIEPRDNFEGLTCLGDRRCLLVTDDGGSADERTLLVLVRISGPSVLADPLPASPPLPPGRR
jgi:hypothetical protein